MRIFTPDGYVEVVVCPTCGALVLDADAHRLWHLKAKP